MADLIDRKEAIKVLSNDSLDVKCFCVIGRGKENRELAKTINDYVDLLLETAKRKILSLPKADTEQYIPYATNYPMEALTFAIACSHCKNINSDKCGDCKKEIKSGFEVDKKWNQERHAHWIKSKIPNEEYTCSNCGGACWYYDYSGTVCKSKYCPNCGCKMDEVVKCRKK